MLIFEDLIKLYAMLAIVCGTALWMTFHCDGIPAYRDPRILGGIYAIFGLLIGGFTITPFAPTLYHLGPVVLLGVLIVPVVLFYLADLFERLLGFA